MWAAFDQSDEYTEARETPLAKVEAPPTEVETVEAKAKPTKVGTESDKTENAPTEKKPAKARRARSRPQPKRTAASAATPTEDSSNGEPRKRPVTDRLMTWDK